jgi:hypothetical protein
MSIRPRLEKYVHDCRTFPGDALLAYRLEGARGVWEALAARTVDRVLRTGHVVIFAQLLSSARRVAPPPGVTIRHRHAAKSLSVPSAGGKRAAWAGCLAR